MRRKKTWHRHRLHHFFYSQNSRRQYQCALKISFHHHHHHHPHYCFGFWRREIVKVIGQEKKKEPLYFRFIGRGTGDSKCNSIGYIWLYVTNSICENKRTNVVVIHRNWGAVGIIIWINDFMSLSIRFVHLSPRWISFSRSTLDFGPLTFNAMWSTVR